MRPVFIAESSEFHPHERLQTHQTKGPRQLGFGHIRCGRDRFGFDFLRRKDDVDGVARFGNLAVQKQVESF